MSMRSIEERIAALERANGRLRAALAALLVVLAAAASAAWMVEDVPEVVRARRLEIVDAEGSVAVAAGYAAGEGEGGRFGFVEVKNAANAAQVLLSSDTDPDLGARVTVYNELGSEVAHLGTGEMAPRGKEHGASLSLAFPGQGGFSVAASEPHTRLEVSGPGAGFEMECSRSSYTTARFVRQGIGGKIELYLLGPSGRSSWQRE
jgi:hypothetical protein